MMKKFRKTVALMLIIGLLPVNVVALAAQVTDVPTQHWAYGPISYAIESKMMSVNDKGEFLPDSNIDKFDTAIALARATGYDGSDKFRNDTDFQYQLKIVTAYDDAHETWSDRANDEIAFLLWRGVYEPDDLSTFFVVTEDGESKLRALSLEEICMYTVSATGRSVQAEMGKYETKFNDDSSIDPALKPYIYYYHSLGYVKTDGDGNVKPKSAVSRALMATILFQAFNNAPYNYSASDVTADAVKAEPNVNIYNEPVEQIITADAYELFSGIEDADTAVEAVKYAANLLSATQKRDAAYVDQVVRFAEEALMRACQKTISTDIVSVEDVTTGHVTKTTTTITPGDTLVIDGEAVSELDEEAQRIYKSIKYALTSSGLKTFRWPRTGFIINTNFDQELNIKLNDLELVSDRIRVETPDYTFSFKKEDIEDGTALKFEKTQNGGLKVSGSQYIFVTLGLKPASGSVNYQAVFSSEGQPAGGTYNPYSKKMEITQKGAGVFSVKSNKKSFKDLVGKPQEMREAAEFLASKGIIPGTSADNFSPDIPMKRGDFTLALVKIIGIYEPQQYGAFSDVFLTDSYHNSVVSAKNYGLVEGFTGDEFQGDKIITNEQAMGMSMRALTKQMGYIPGDLKEHYLKFYDIDTVSTWAKANISPAYRTGLVIRREDNFFKPYGNVSRGDAAVLLKRVYDKLYH